MDGCCFFFDVGRGGRGGDLLICHLAGEYIILCGWRVCVCLSEDWASFFCTDESFGLSKYLILSCVCLKKMKVLFVSSNVNLVRE